MKNIEKLKSKIRSIIFKKRRHTMNKLPAYLETDFYAKGKWWGSTNHTFAPTPAGQQKFGAITYSTGNIGDDVQTLAAMQYLPKCDSFVDRDSISEEERGMSMIGNAFWMIGDTPKWPPKPSVRMLGISMAVHNRNMSLEWFKKNEPIGCRDTETVKFLQSKGIRAFFSGCLTLTFPLYQGNRENRTVFVDCKPPKKMKNTIEISHNIKPKQFSNHLERLKLAGELLELYRTSSLVVTDRIHVAFPCIAFGTPVFLFKSERSSNQTVRLAGYEFLPINESLSDLDFNQNYLIPRPEKLISNLRERVLEFVRE